MTKSATREAADKVTFTQTEVTSAVALKAPIASPSFTGSSSTFDSVSGDLSLYLTTGHVADKNEIVFGDGSVNVAQMGVGGTSGDIITGSTGQDFNIRTGGGGRAINFSTDNGSSTAMKIDNGNMLFGKTSVAFSVAGIAFRPSNGATADFIRNNGTSINTNRLGSNGATIIFHRADANVGNISVTTSATSYNTSSDYRLKTDVQPMTGATDRVKLLKPCNFEWIVDGTRVDGFLAHEAEEVVPEAVSGTKDAMMDEEYEVTAAVLDDEGVETTAAVMGTRSVPDMQGIDQSKLVPLLTATIQELIARIEALEA